MGHFRRRTYTEEEYVSGSCAPFSGSRIGVVVRLLVVHTSSVLVVHTPSDSRVPFSGSRILGRWKTSAWPSVVHAGWWCAFQWCTHPQVVVRLVVDHAPLLTQAVTNKSPQTIPRHEGITTSRARDGGDWVVVRL